jgi:signal transduction histidine kinase
MGQTNQIFFIIFCAITVGLMLVIIPQYRMALIEKPSLFWPASISLYFFSCLAFGLAASVSMVLMTIANTTLICSVLALNFLYRSWMRKPFTLVQGLFLLCIPIIFMCLYEPLRVAVDTFRERVALASGIIIFLMLWQSFDLYQFAKESTSKVLHWLLVLTLFVISVTFIRAYMIISADGPNTLFLDNENGLWFALRWLCFSSYNLVFFALTGYYFEKQIHEKYQLAKVAEIGKIENERVSALLIEKEQLINSLIKANKSAATGALSASIAHELNQPLTAINANLFTLERLMQSSNINMDEVKQIVGWISADNHRSADIVKALGSIFRDEELKLGITSIANLIESILIIVEPECKATQIQLRVDIEPGLEVRLQENEIKQLLLNLLNNAIASLANSDISNRQIDIVAKRIDEQFVLSISDNGPGVAAQMQYKLFDLLQSDKRGGLGLGLWLCRHIAIRHQGNLQFANIMPHGAKFTLTTPLF